MANRPSSSDPETERASASELGRGSGEPTTRQRDDTAPEGGIVLVAWYADGSGHERAGAQALDELPALLRAEQPAVWVDLGSPSPEQVERVGEILGLHPLIVEDVLEGNQRPKIEVTDELIHMVLFRLEYDVGVSAIETDLVLGPGFLLSIHDRSWDPRSIDHLRSGAGPILARGADHMLWALCDAVVDGYFPIADRLGDALDVAQDDVVRRPAPEVLERVFILKRDLQAVRRIIAPVREVFNQLTNREVGTIDREEIIWFRDVYDHVIRLTDEIDSYRELAATTLEVYLTQVNNNLSVIMKRLTGVTVILAGVGAVAGIFGMSEAGAALTGTEATGFWLVTFVTVMLAVLAVTVLRRIDWI
jgi:magnesium transporter